MIRKNLRIEVKAMPVSMSPSLSQSVPPPLAAIASNGYLFGPFHLDIGAMLLFANGEPLSLGRPAVLLLHALLEKPGIPVAKQTLMDAAWGGRAVEESNLTVQIAALRRALAQAGGAEWIETWPRRGYRFVGPPARRQGATIRAAGQCVLRQS